MFTEWKQSLYDERTVIRKQHIKAHIGSQDDSCVELQRRLILLKNLLLSFRANFALLRKTTESRWINGRISILLPQNICANAISGFMVKALGLKTREVHFIHLVTAQ